jgi:hypothetical protein
VGTFAPVGVGRNVAAPGAVTVSVPRIDGCSVQRNV